MKINKSTKALATSILALGVSANLQGSIIYESFSDTDSTLRDNAAGTGLTGNWSNTGGSGGFDVSGTSLSYGSLTTAGGSAIYLAGASGAGNRANAATTLTGAATAGSLENAGLLSHGAELWFSVLQRVSNNAAHDGHAFAFSSDRLFANTDFNPAGTQGIGFAMSNTGSLSARVSTDAGVHVNGAGTDRFNLAETIMVVGRINWGADAATADTVTLFLPGTDLQLGTAVSTASAVIDQSVFDTVTFFQRQQGSATVPSDVGVDEIRFGATSLDVTPVPEPSSTALLCLGGLALILRRSK
jgi:hypothetical protein